MIDIAELIKFVEKEQVSQQIEEQTRDLLSIQALVSLGHAINGLKVVSKNHDALKLECIQNNSRFRPGDRLVFSHEQYPPFKAILYSLTDHGRILYVRGNNLPETVGIGSWIATEDSTNLSYSIITALRKLQPGAPGWQFTKLLFGDKRVNGIEDNLAHKPLLEELISETNLSLDSSQVEVFLKSLSLPVIYGIQGPPGTGKTVVLSFVIEALMRLGKRVALLAPTHQAVNNALTTTHQLFPKRQVIKFGDELRTESLAVDIPIITSPLKIKKEPLSSLIGMTFMSAIHHMLISDQKMLAPNVVVIDEAGQLPLVQGACVGLSGAGSVLLFGDDKQMPPVFIGDLSEETLAVSLFSQLRAAQPKVISMLNITYRMNESLCQTVGSVFYDEKSDNSLQPSDKARHRQFMINFEPVVMSQELRPVFSPDKTLVWLQVLSRNCMQFNPWEGQLAADIVVACLKAGFSSEKIAVVTPFRRQVMNVRRLINAQIGDKYDLPIVDTVERVQGLTVEAVVISLCASEPEYIEAIAEFLFSPNRLNVAVSRARSKVIVISNPSIFDVLPRSYKGLLSRSICQSLLTSPQFYKYTASSKIYSSLS